MTGMLLLRRPVGVGPDDDLRRLAVRRGPRRDGDDGDERADGQAGSHSYPASTEHEGALLEAGWCAPNEKLFHSHETRAGA